MAFSIDMNAKETKYVVYLTDFGDTSPNNIDSTFKKAIAQIDGKCLILPDKDLLCGDIIIEGKNNFVIRGSRNYLVSCKHFQLKNSSNFEILNLKEFGTRKNFSYFDVIGDCHNFYIHNCSFNSEKDSVNNNTFYGIHVRCDATNPGFNETNSPRNFKISNNLVKNSKYDGILVHSCCTNFTVNNNIVENPQCIGIEVEGRTGGNNSTEVHWCRNGKIVNNKISNCGDWGILLMWADNLTISNNISKDALGCFLSIGCKNSKITNNVLEGKQKGFEISQEYYSVNKGFNDNMIISNNIIKGRARSNNRGVLDIRHSKNIHIFNNKITAYYFDSSAYLSVASSQSVKINGNNFYLYDKPLSAAVLIDNVVDPETKEKIKALNIKKLTISYNHFGKTEKNIINNLGDVLDFDSFKRNNRFTLKQVLSF